MVFDPPVELFAAALAVRRVRRSSPRNYSRWPCRATRLVFSWPRLGLDWASSGAPWVGY